MAYETFNVPYVRAHTRKLSFKTEVDSEYTPNEQRCAIYDNGIRSWNLSFQKTPEALAEVESFFDRHRGKFKAFYWKYARLDKYGRLAGGDDITRLVRFDIDDFEPQISTLGYGYFSLPIVVTKA